MLENYKSYEINKANMEIIRQKFADKPGVVLVQGINFISRLEQLFVKIQQWKAERNTDTLPNHIDMVKKDYAIGALGNGVEGDELWAHFKHHEGGRMWLVDLNIKEHQLNDLWTRFKFAEKRGYAYLDLLWIGIHILTSVWLGKKSNNNTQKRYTCQNLFAVLFNRSYYHPLFPYSRRATSYTVIRQMSFYPNIFRFEKK